MQHIYCENAQGSTNINEPHKQLSWHRQIHDVLSKASEFSSMSRLGHVVSNHQISWTVLYINVSFLLLISDKEQSNVQVPGSLACTLVAIRFQ